MSLWKSSFNNQVQISFLILRAPLMCVRGSRSLTTHSGNHAVDDFEIAFDYTLAWDMMIWDLKRRVCFESLWNNVYNFLFFGKPRIGPFLNSITSRLAFTWFFDIRRTLGNFKVKRTRKTCFSREMKRLALHIYLAKFC